MSPETPVFAGCFFSRVVPYCHMGMNPVFIFEPPRKRKEKKSALARLLARRRVDELTGCWVWQGALCGSGYGQISVSGEAVLVHRLSWEVHVGPIPEGMNVLHKAIICHRKNCINPKHLYLGTLKNNSADQKLDALHRGQFI